MVALNNMATGGCSFMTIRDPGRAAGGWSGPAVSPQAQDPLFRSTGRVYMYGPIGLIFPRQSGLGRNRSFSTDGEFG